MRQTITHCGRSFAVWALLLTGLASSPSAPAAHTFQVQGEPDLRSASALVMDEHGHVIYGKDTDTVRPIASLTKLMTVMVTLDGRLDLDSQLEITRADRDRVQLTGSRLEFGARLSRRELILLSIMSSENRAASALGRTWPGGTQAFVERMNQRAVELDMRQTHFSDPAGLRADNRSTASDLGKLVRAADRYDLIREASTTRRIEVRPYPRRGPLVYGNTNRLLKNKTWEIGLSKTGYLNESGRCLVMQARIGGHPVYIVLLNSFGKLTPFGDSNRLRKWLLANG